LNEVITAVAYGIQHSVVLLQNAYLQNSFQIFCVMWKLQVAKFS